MIKLVSEAIEKYAQAHTEPQSAILEELTKETYAQTALPQMLVGHLEGAFLRLLVRLLKARHILELGTFTGYSALSMAEVMPVDSHSS